MDGGRLRRSTLVAAGVAAAVAAAGAAQRTPESASGRALDAEAVSLVARVNVSTSGAQADGPTVGAVLSANGRYVAFASRATTLVRRDRNRTSDVFVHDLRTSRTTRVSVSSAGAEASGASLLPSISADGRTVAFPSSATNLVPDDRNAVQDVFVRDRATATTRRVSLGLDGEANGRSLAPFVSGDGSIVAFSSEASNLVFGDTNGTLDVFVARTTGGPARRVSVGLDGQSDGRSEASAISADGRIVAFRSFATNLVGEDRNERADVFACDLRTGSTGVENVSSRGAQANGATFRGMLSGSGRFVGFRSRASNLVPGDTNDALDVFEHDRATGRTTRVSVASDGAEADSRGVDWRVRESLFVSRPFLSADGRFAAFTSRAPNLVAGDRNGMPDVFVHDLESGRTIRVSVSIDGREANAPSFVSGISADGRVVAFTSFASNLVAGDTNGRKDVFVAYLWRAPQQGLGHVGNPEPWSRLVAFSG